MPGGAGGLHCPACGAAYPSQTDINLASYPDALYLIVSLAEEEDPLRGFTIREGKVDEVDLVIQGSSEA